MMKLHWSPRSPFVRKVMVFALETGLADRIERVRTVADSTKPNKILMLDNPLSKIPTLVLDDGTVLFDSLIICDYLDTLHEGQPLIPDAGKLRWQAMRWHSLGNGMLDALILWRHERDRPPEKSLAVLIAAFEAKIKAALSMLENEVEALEATPFGIGHIAIACMFGYLDFRFASMDWRGQHPKLSIWFARVAMRPSMQATAIKDDQ